MLSNDTLNGDAVVPGEVTLTDLGTGDTELSLSGSDVVVASGTAAGSYTLDYQICENLNPTNCDSATVTVTVTATAIAAVDDSGTANGYTGGTAVTDVLSNDTLNGDAVVPGEVTLTDLGTGDTELSLSGSDVVVASGTAAGSYTLDYQICENLNPTNCDSATVTVTVTATAIAAVDDSGTANGYTGGTAVTDVLSNDTLNGDAVVPGEVTLTDLGTGDTELSLSGSDVVVASGTAAGSYTLDYQICENLNPTNCDSATVTVTVTATAIAAVDDPARPTATPAAPRSPTCCPTTPSMATR